MVNFMRLSFLAGVVTFLAAAPSFALEKYNLLMGGYYDGPSVAGAVGFGDIFEKFPIGAEIDLGYSWTRKGDAILARQVFIDQATGGNDQAQSSGGVLDLGINATYPLNREYGAMKFHVFGGVRYARWAVRHQYKGGNEDFDVVSHRWGMGGGLRGIIKLNTNFSAFAQLGLDFYFKSSIYGHDATYFPNDRNENARSNGAGYTYTYSDAERATTVPRFRPRVMVGLQF